MSAHLRRASGGHAQVRAAALLAAIIALGLFVACQGVARAQSPIPQPAINLGMTSFLDGEGAPGFAFETIGNGYQAWRLNDAGGGKIPGQNRQAIASVALHPIYISTATFLGGNLGFDAIVPIVHLRNEFSGAVGSDTALGDVTFTPQLQWSNLSLFSRPFSMRLGLQVVAPTGAYDRNYFVNAGQNIWQISPYYAFTLRTSDRWEVSGRLTYDWGSANRDLPISSGLSSAQPGDQIGINLAASYAVTDRWRLGLGGYVLQQLTDTRVEGVALSRSRQRVFGVGPGLLWSTPHATVIANVYREFAAENRPEGYQGVLRVIMPF